MTHECREGEEADSAVSHAAFSFHAGDLTVCVTSPPRRNFSSGKSWNCAFVRRSAAPRLSLHYKAAMNSSDKVPLTTDMPGTNVTENMGALTSRPTQADTTVIQVLTTAVPPDSHCAVIAVVVAIILLTLAVFGFLLYRYLCHNKGDYRTTGELAPGEDLDDEQSNQAVSEKKEYFI
ncbi:hypothetical protein JOB18_042918 [Solea senegalensis]|uniref:Uncharacterized protein n=1 Tax=Solea senegalensis TaxID=28829 RepID=A0AAV6ST83_SOLSE|nr:hypothetical protein JOB18_042918 [Solea senegalensis]